MKRAALRLAAQRRRLSSELSAVEDPLSLLAVDIGDLHTELGRVGTATQPASMSVWLRGVDR